MGNIIGDIVNGVASVANNVVGAISNKRQQKRNQEYTERNMQLQHEYNMKEYEKQKNDAYAREDWLNENSERIKQNARTSAGINGAWLEGQTGFSTSSVDSGGNLGGVTPNTPNNAPLLTAKGLNDSYIAAMQLRETMENNRVQRDKIKAETDAINRENKGNAEADNLQDLLAQKSVSVGEDGLFYYENDMGEKERLDVAPRTQKGAEYVNKFREMLKNEHVFLSQSTKADLDNMVNRSQIKDTSVLKALSKMPNELWRELKTKNDYQSIENEVSEFFKSTTEKINNNPTTENQIIKTISGLAWTFFHTAK